ncbi:hypothetical protein [Clostridium omnivorum]|uniref:Uncharacterized protein n=1 Tax=Clostridium omnivorum TaxID=1604902 RepID=A0ABQ5NCZ9_9CLOT|nr:hypothetical protein [Clostridium sp. E14]GLC32902.1 hypothetical protein bsdE14_43120 [Clostridium sp. E14]
MNKKLTVFALKDKNEEYQLDYDFDKLSAFNEKFGYAFILSFSSEMISLANRLKDIEKVIDVLEDWKNEEFFKLNETTYSTSWFNSKYKKEKTELTLPQAKKIYMEKKVMVPCMILKNF